MTEFVILEIRADIWKDIQNCFETGKATGEYTQRYQFRADFDEPVGWHVFISVLNSTPPKIEGDLFNSYLAHLCENNQIPEDVGVFQNVFVFEPKNTQRSRVVVLRKSENADFNNSTDAYYRQVQEKPDTIDFPENYKYTVKNAIREYGIRAVLNLCTEAIGGYSGSDYKNRVLEHIIAAIDEPED